MFQSRLICSHFKAFPHRIHYKYHICQKTNKQLTVFNCLRKTYRTSVHNLQRVMTRNRIPQPFSMVFMQSITMKYKLESLMRPAVPRFLQAIPSLRKSEDQIFGIIETSLLDKQPCLCSRITDPPRMIGRRTRTACWD